MRLPDSGLFLTALLLCAPAAFGAEGVQQAPPQNQLQQQQQQPQSAAPISAATGMSSAPVSSPEALGGGTPAVETDPKKIRDPFKRTTVESDGDGRMVSEVELVALDQLKLAGIVRGAARTRVMVVAPSGKAFLLGEGMRIGKGAGKIKHIGDNGITVVESRTDMIGGKELVTTEVPLRAEGKTRDSQVALKSTVRDDVPPSLPASQGQLQPQAMQQMSEQMPAAQQQQQQQQPQQPMQQQPQSFQQQVQQQFQQQVQQFQQQLIQQAQKVQQQYTPSQNGAGQGSK